MRELDCMAAQAAVDEGMLNRLIAENERFLLRCSSLATHRYITKCDDEWSIALTAFDEAVKNYDYDKGSFLSFAEMVIRRRLVDFLRSDSKFRSEIPIGRAESGTREGDEDEEISLYDRKAIAEYAALEEQRLLKYEIEAANEVFAQYGFTFMDLAQCSPKSEKTRAVCAKAVRYLLRNPLLLREMRAQKQVPQKILEKNLNVPRKKLERHRKYIIAAVELLSGEYPYLADYMHFIKEVDHEVSNR